MLADKDRQFKIKNTVDIESWCHQTLCVVNSCFLTPDDLTNASAKQVQQKNLTKHLYMTVSTQMKKKTHLNSVQLYYAQRTIKNSKASFELLDQVKTKFLNF